MQNPKMICKSCGFDPSIPPYEYPKHLLKYLPSAFFLTWKTVGTVGEYLCDNCYSRSYFFFWWNS